MNSTKFAFPSSFLPEKIGTVEYSERVVSSFKDAVILAPLLMLFWIFFHYEIKISPVAVIVAVVVVVVVVAAVAPEGTIITHF